MIATPSRHYWLLFTFLALPVVCGCGGGGASLSGTVSYEGVPVENGMISLYPTDDSGPSQAGKIVQGKYTLSGVSPGKKRVKIMATKEVAPVEVGKTRAEGAKERSAAAVARKNKQLPTDESPLPDDAVGNNVVIEVAAGSQTQDFDLKKPEPKAKGTGKK